jgi:nucleoside 2-deoxyribosyltransferase
MRELQEYRYETPIEDIDFNFQTIFLAGPTVRGHQPHLKSWRPDAVTLLRNKKFAGNVIIPEFTDRKESDKYRYDVPQWEFAGLQKCHAILCWLPRTRELIGLTTNFELGYWIARERGKLIYGRPDDAYRVTYCDIMWVEDAKRREREVGGGIHIQCPIYNTLEKTVDATLKKFTPWSLA